MISDQNLYVLEVRHGAILYLNARTRARDGWHWGSDERFVAGPFESLHDAVSHARLAADQARLARNALAKAVIR